MEDFIEEYLGVIRLASLEQFVDLFYEASSEQLDSIKKSYDASSGVRKESLHDDGVQATMVRRLGQELILISLFHLFERHLKEIVKYLAVPKLHNQSSSATRFNRWSDIKAYIPVSVKSTSNFQRVNLLRVLVNCFKHAGIVSDELYRLDPSFGSPGEEIGCDMEVLYNEFKDNVKLLVKDVYETYKT